MTLVIGQQIADGKIVIANLNDDGSVHVIFTSIVFPATTPEPFSVDVNPNTTVGALEALLAALQAIT